MSILGILLYIVPLLFSVIAHEYMHGRIAEKFGDPTARLMGRLTFNPLKHIDPIGSILVPFVMYLSSTTLMGTPIVIGWARPVPINYYNLRNPRKDMVWISLAGPLANLSIALVAGILIRILTPFHGLMAGPLLPLYLLIVFLVIVNVGLAFFNLIPIPPLDGSRVLAGLLPPRWAYAFLQYEKYGLFIIIGIIIVGNLIGIDLLQLVLAPPMNLVSRLFTGFSVIQLLRLIA